jgi:hypothetical protein
MDNKVTTGEKTREERAIFERKKTQRQFDQDDDKDGIVTFYTVEGLTK